MGSRRFEGISGGRLLGDGRGEITWFTLPRAV
jgi:hypothetical protein